MLDTAYFLLSNSHFGQIVYRLSGYKIFRQPEDHPDYVIPEKYLSQVKDIEPGDEEISIDTDETATAEKSNHILVEWETDDPQNPQNWPMLTKVLFAIIISYMTMVSYIGGAISSSIAGELKKEFHISNALSQFPMSFYIFGYGFGPMLISPMSESPYIGRSIPYVYTLIIFTVLQIPTALAKNIGSLTVLRFLAGMLISPPLATGAASYADITPVHFVPAIFVIWGLSAFCGPAIAPLIGTALTMTSVGWRMVFWLILALGGFCTILVFFFLPESSPNAILYGRAKRLRKLTGNNNIVTQAELDSKKMTKHQLAVDILWRPFEVILKEPMVLLMDIFQGLAYGLVYIWFEGFPIVFEQVYHFRPISQALAFLSIIVGTLIGGTMYLSILRKTYQTKILQGIEVKPEVFLDTSMLGTLFLAGGIFIFGWTSTASVHWIVPLIGGALFGVGSITVLQSNVNYLVRAFPRYIASVLAGNALFRSSFGGAFPIFSRSLYLNLSTKKYPVGWGSTLLGFITLAMILIPFVYKKWGPQLRNRSKYSK